MIFVVLVGCIEIWEEILNVLDGVGCREKAQRYPRNLCLIDNEFRSVNSIVKPKSRPVAVLSLICYTLYTR